MKKFLKDTFVFCFFFFLACFFVFIQADGSADAFYVKFTTPKQESMIIGSSRAGQDLQPLIFKSVFKNKYKLYNYGFTIKHTPFGKAYLNSIKNKIDSTDNKGLFIIEVNPWTVSSSASHKEDSLHFRENGNFIERTNFVNMKPNIEYLLESYQTKYLDLIVNKYRTGEYQTFYVTSEGWLQVSIESDLFSKEKRTYNKLTEYKEKLKSYKGISETRINYLFKTIEFLRRYGAVYLLRVPINDNMLALENQLAPDFNERMISLSNEFKIPYINMMPFNYEYDYTDGHHLTIESGRRLSKAVATIILELKNNSYN